MATFVVRGGKPLKGTYFISGAKNAAPKILITSLLTDEKCLFRNIPRFSDTFRSVDAIVALGGSARFIDKNSIEIQCDSLERLNGVADGKFPEIPFECQSARQSVLFIGAALARFGRVKIYPPKGDKIGKRPLNRHLDGIRALGGSIEDCGTFMKITMPRRPSSVTYRFQKNTHCGTENLILASVFNAGKIILENAAEEPEVNNLIETLNSMGARIRRIKPRVIEIEGVKPLLRGCAVKSIYDRLEAATALTLSIISGGNIKVKNCPWELVSSFTAFLEDIGVQFRWGNDTAEVYGISLPLKPADITTDRHPGFITDWQPLAALLLSLLSEGKSRIHERIYEKRWRYLEELKKMGLRYSLSSSENHNPEEYNFNDSEYQKNDPYVAYVYGPTELKPAELHSHDVRAGVNALLAALIASGKSVIYDPLNHIDRGYENIVEKLKSLGADIDRG